MNLCDQSVLRMSQNHAITKRKGIKSKTDHFSELPDEILSSIVSYFSLRDAVNASLLSSRWGHVCASMYKLDFTLISIFQPLISTFQPDEYGKSLLKRDTLGTCRQYKDRFVRAVNQFLQFYKGSRPLHFAVSFCLGKENSVDIDQWVIFAVNMGVKDFHLRLSCGNCHAYGGISRCRKLYMLRSELFSQGNVSKIEKLYLRSCILGPGIINQFRGLKILGFTHVSLGAHEIESIFSCCLNLEHITLGQCSLIPILRIPGSLKQLKYFAVLICRGVQEIKLSAANLTCFDYDCGTVKYSFSSAPNLKEVVYRAREEIGMSYVFSQLAKDLPLVEFLSLYTTTNWVQCLPGQITTFNKLKQLEFYSLRKVNIDIMKIIAILKACPLLEKFRLGILSLDSEQEMPGIPMPCECVHKYLKEVHISGFHASASYIELALCMLEYGAALERMVIDPKSEFYYGVGAWLETKRMTWDEGERAKACSLLHKHSKSSLIIIR